jgi:DNA invertase Pin-like site-specific DNA recombinase
MPNLDLTDDEHVALVRLGEARARYRPLFDVAATVSTPTDPSRSWPLRERLMLTVPGGLAEFEKELIRARASEGRARAKARGVKLGRKPKLTEHQKREAIKRRDRNGEAVSGRSPAATTSATVRFPHWPPERGPR